MTKHFILSVVLRSGKRVAIAADNSQELIDEARKIRDAGKLDGKPVQCGVVMSTVRGIVMRFACREAVKAVKTVKEEEA